MLLEHEPLLAYFLRAVSCESTMAEAFQHSPAALVAWLLLGATEANRVESEAKQADYSTLLPSSDVEAHQSRVTIIRFLYALENSLDRRRCFSINKHLAEVQRQGNNKETFRLPPLFCSSFLLVFVVVVLQNEEAKFSWRLAERGDLPVVVLKQIRRKTRKVLLDC